MVIHPAERHFEYMFDAEAAIFVASLLAKDKIERERSKWLMGLFDDEGSAFANHFNSF